MNRRIVEVFIQFQFLFRAFVFSPVIDAVIFRKFEYPGIKIFFLFEFIDIILDIQEDILGDIGGIIPVAGEV